MKRYQILLPGGELLEDVLAYLNKAGIFVKFKNRCYRATVPNLPLEFVVVRASSIPDLISNPVFPNIVGGITGSDILIEAGIINTPTIPISLLVPDYVPSQMFLGVRPNLINKSLNGLTIATKYPSIAKQYLLSSKTRANIFYIPGKDEAMLYLSQKVAGIIGIKKSGNTQTANNIIVRDTIFTCSPNWIKRQNLDRKSSAAVTKFETLIRI